jgi:cytidylate kinase
VPIRVLTIEREYGSGGAVIAERMAQRLGWTLWDKQITSEIANLSQTLPKPGQTDERHAEPHDPLLYRLSKVFARGSYERSLPIQSVEGHDAERVVQLVMRVIERIGESGQSVIVGRGAAYILRDMGESFHVFVFAPYEEKLRRVLASGKSREEAVELLDTVDRERAAFVKQYTGRDWPNRYLYDLWINSAMGDDAVIETILGSMELLDRRGVSAKPSR